MISQYLEEEAPTMAFSLLLVESAYKGLSINEVIFFIDLNRVE